MVLSSCTSVLLALAVAGPSSSAVGRRPRGDEGAVGIVWDGQATGASKIEQRLVDTLAQRSVERGAATPATAAAARSGEAAAELEAGAVLEHADQRARVAIAVEIPRARADRVVRLGQGLADATVRFRGGSLAAADAAARGVLAALDADPLLPGAATIAFAAHMLRVQIAWTAGDDARARAMARVAVALDPDAVLSTRQVPPAVAALHEQVRQSVAAERDAWLPISIEFDRTSGPMTVEIDGRPGRRPLPAGRHCVVIRRPGRAPVAYWADAGATLVVPVQPEILRVGFPVDRGAAEAICDHAGASRLVLAQAKPDRLALEGYLCGEGFVGAWYSDLYVAVAPTPGPSQDHLAEGVAAVTTPTEAVADHSVLASAAPWPAPRRPPAEVTDEPDPRRTETLPKPWFRRVWIWSLVGGAVVAGVTVGAVLGTREQAPEIRVDADTFIGP